MNRRSLGALSALVLALGCQKTGSPPRTSAAAATAAGASSVELRTLDDRPALGLVLREGDPRGAVAVAVAHDFGSEASLALSAVVAARLGRAGIRNVSVRAHGLGWVISSLVSTPADAARFVGATTSALTSPLSAQERPRERGRAPVLRGPAEAAVQACSGELGVAEAGSAPEAPDAQALEQWRAQLGSASVAFAAVGPRPLLDALAGAVAAGEKWPAGPTPSDRWPEADSIGTHRSGERRLSVAFRVADAARAVEVAQTIAAPGSVLATRLGALDGTFRLDRVVATSRIRGACLRIDVRAPSPDTSVAEVARAVSVVDEEARTQLDGRAGLMSTLDDAVVRPAHPEEAASAAAWRALIARQPGAASRRAVSWLGPGPGGAELERVVAALDAGRNKSSVERRVRLETGQGELYALVASPCGTTPESSDDAGVHEVLLRALAQKRNGLLGVQVEPWITPDAVGLLAHAPRTSAHESPEEHAKRIGDALGRALVASRLGGAEVAEVKTELLGEIGLGQRGYFAALDAAGGGRPSWLDPRGTWRAVSNVSTQAAEARRRAFVAGPLRLAVLANARTEQAEAAGSALERWLRPLRGDAGGCASTGRVTPQGGELGVEVSQPAHARAYLAYPTSGLAREAEWTVFLLNRPGGWLEQALRGAGEARARAAFVGGKNAAAVLIEIQAAESERAAAVSRLRALVQRLAKGEASEADVELARRHFDAHDGERALDPRGRVVELWRGAPPAKPDLGSLRRFHQALGSAKEIVVHAKAKE